MGKNTHMSFFFVAMRGPIDDLLPWPFKQKVILTLINQMSKKDVTDSFRPDVFSFILSHTYLRLYSGLAERNNSYLALSGTLTP